jgi:hypothetical protein
MTGYSRRPDVYTTETDPDTGEELLYANRGLCTSCREAPATHGEKCAGCAAIRARPPCVGCGYFYATHGAHRDDCTITNPRKETRT